VALLEGDGGGVTEGGVQSMGVIEALDELKDGQARLAEGRQAGPCGPLVPQGSEEALGHGVALAQLPTEPIEARTTRSRQRLPKANGDCTLARGAAATSRYPHRVRSRARVDAKGPTPASVAEHPHRTSGPQTVAIGASARQNKTLAISGGFFATLFVRSTGARSRST
jgi:hypothetical protein